MPFLHFLFTNADIVFSTLGLFFLIIGLVLFIRNKYQKEYVNLTIFCYCIGGIFYLLSGLFSLGSMTIILKIFVAVISFYNAYLIKKKV